MAVGRLTVAFFLVSLLHVTIGQIASNPITNCPKLAPHKPKDVNDLTPGDFKIVMALGDSITAGFGLMGQAGALDEFRGWSGFIGGNENNVTLPDFFRHYQPLVTGFSINQHFLELAGMDYHPEDRCNAAQSGATTTDLHAEVDHILKVLKNESTVDFTNDWKFLNILIGANDACPLCKRGDKPTIQAAGDTYEQNLNDAITYVYENFPNTLVNIIPLFNLSGVYYLGLNKTYCKDFHDLFPWECPCAFDSTTENREYLDDVVSEYRTRVVAIADQWQSMQLPDFTVIYQPFTWDINIAQLPLDWISTLDCFHPSYIAHQIIAINIWNSMFLPLSEKPYMINENPTIYCPKATDRIWTN